MIACSNCGMMNNDGAQYCNRCGTRFTDNQLNTYFHLSKFSTSEDILKSINITFMPRFINTTKSYHEIEVQINNPRRNMPLNPPKSTDEIKVWEWLTRVELSINNYARITQIINDAYISLLQVSSEDISIEEYSEASLLFTKNQIMDLLKTHSDSYKLLLTAINALRNSLSLVLDK